MITPQSLTIAGATIPLDEIVADITIRHGRAGVADSAVAASFQATLLEVDHAFVSAFRTGDPLVFTALDGATSFPRFTGWITDASLDVDEFTILAVGPLSKLPNYLVGLVAWSSEPWSVRVARIFAEAGLTSTLVLQGDPTFNPTLAARAAEAIDVLSALEETNLAVGGLVADLPDGRTLVQALGYRSYTAQVHLDPELVEYAPQWTLALPGPNIVTVEYATGSTTHEDTPARTFYGPRPDTTTTSIVALADADKRALQRLGRTANPHWQIGGAPLLEPMRLPIGQCLELSTLPDAAPYDPWNPVLEGWTDLIQGAEWRQELNLSDPLDSGLTLPWNVVSSSELWSTVNPATSWAEALTPSDL